MRHSNPPFHARCHRFAVPFAASFIAAALSGCGGSSPTDFQTDPAVTPAPAPAPVKASDTIAFRWNQVLLEAIRNDLARPPVHARNLFHLSAAMYDIWAQADTRASPYLLGQQRLGVDCTTAVPNEGGRIDMDRAISYAAYRLIEHRFGASPGAATIRRQADALMSTLGLDPEDRSTDRQRDAAVALGNDVAACYIALGLADGANEANDYANQHYRPVNPPLVPAQPGNASIIDPDRWQSLSLPQFIDQAGNPVIGVPAFVGAEWGRVAPFALTDADRSVYRRDGVDWPVYLDPGPPPRQADGRFDDYRWHYAMVARWAAQLDPADGVMIDISPGAIGNIGGDYLRAPVDPRSFYRVEGGGDPGMGRPSNPATGQPYAPQRVPRGDYTRVLAEFWADGPDSETPPGHWFVILNSIADPLASGRPMPGDNEDTTAREWLLKAYFTLGASMHDAAIAAWGIKGWYDTVRPISAIRAMADAGQGSDAAAPDHDVRGLPLEPGSIERVEAGDALAGANGEHVGKIKLRSWRGPDAIGATGSAGVGWILAERWWPYQRPSFVTPPFAGYVSGHSTYSSAAATVLEQLTGDPYFPGGLYEVPIDARRYLVFEVGPSQSMKLQWATYRDAADQCSLSRIWGGIHPPADDLPGRRIGVQIGEKAVAAALRLFGGG